MDSIYVFSLSGHTFKIRLDDPSDDSFTVATEYTIEHDDTKHGGSYTETMENRLLIPIEKLSKIIDALQEMQWKVDEYNKESS